MVKFRLPEGLIIPSLRYKYISLLLKKNPKMDVTKLFCDFLENIYPGDKNNGTRLKKI